MEDDAGYTSDGTPREIINYHPIKFWLGWDKFQHLVISGVEVRKKKIIISFEQEYTELTIYLVDMEGQHSYFHSHRNLAPLVGDKLLGLDHKYLSWSTCGGDNDYYHWSYLLRVASGREDFTFKSTSTAEIVDLRFKFR